MARFITPDDIMDESDFYALQRAHSHSQSKLLSSGFDHEPSSTSGLLSQYPNPIKFSASLNPPDSPPIMMEGSPDLSYSSTPMSTYSVSSDSDCDGDVRFAVADDDFVFRPYTDDFFPPVEDEDLEPPFSPKTTSRSSPALVSPPDVEPLAATHAVELASSSSLSSSSSSCGDRAEDDTAVMRHPSRHVDYLSHEWKEEDLWSSWKYIVSRRGEVENSERLENASWRSWTKAKNRLPTVSPETLNWLKDCDVTWLYGPLQHGSSDLFRTEGETPRSATNSFVINKKPILKKRSLSEIMLLESLSAASLLKQATAAVQAQACTSPGLRPSGASSDHLSPYPLSPRRISGDMASLATSSTSSGLLSPNSERKHIQFNEQVEQCIAVEIKCDEEDDMDSEHYEDTDSSSDDGLTMKQNWTKKRTPFGRKPTNKRRKSSSESKTIAMLPSTTLKHHEDAAELPPPPATPMAGQFLSTSSPSIFNPILSRSSSQETLRPTVAVEVPAPASTPLFLSDDEDDEMDAYADWQMPNFGTFQDAALPDTTSPACYEEPAGMRRTPSGMFMPIGESETDEHATTDGLFGRVIDVVNTAKDIGHVIWNVGWSGR